MIRGPPSKNEDTNNGGIIRNEDTVDDDIRVLTNEALFDVA